MCNDDSILNAISRYDQKRTSQQQPLRGLQSDYVPIGLNGKITYICNVLLYAMVTKEGRRDNEDGGGRFGDHIGCWANAFSDPAILASNRHARRMMRGIILRHVAIPFLAGGIDSSGAGNEP